jgi:hypothetical protein
VLCFDAACPVTGQDLKPNKLNDLLAIVARKAAPMLSSMTPSILVM